MKRGNVGVAATWNGVTSDPVQVTVVPSRNVSLTTEWNDSDNQDGSRPEKTTVQLTANGQLTGDPVELNADNNWTYEWKQLLAEDDRRNKYCISCNSRCPRRLYCKSNR
ncbi:MAG: Cna B-type domain-containing protein [Eubacterium ramulus]